MHGRAEWESSKSWWKVPARIATKGSKMELVSDSMYNKRTARSQAASSQAQGPVDQTEAWVIFQGGEKALATSQEYWDVFSVSSPHSG